MSRISSRALISTLTTLLLFVLGPELWAGVSTSVSSERELVLRWTAENQPNPTGIGAKPTKQSNLTSLPVGDSLAINASVICFWSPSPVVNFMSSDVTLGKEVAGMAALEDGPATRIQLIKPVMVRGRWLGKLIVPKFALKNGVWAEVQSADIAVAFGAPEVAAHTASNGPLDRILDDLAVNTAEARNWYGKTTTASVAQVYDPFAQSSNWVRITISEGGAYKITRNDLAGAGVSVATLDPRTIRVFHAGGKPLPVPNSTPRDSLVEMAIKVVGEDDGNLGDQDFVMFFANGGDFNTWGSSVDFVHHPYSDRNVYYLTFGGNFSTVPKRMATENGQIAGAADTLTRFIDYLQFEEESQLSQSGGDVFDYYNWYWGLAGDITMFINLPQPTAQSVNRFRLKVSRPSFSLRVNNFEIVPYDTIGSFYYFETDRLKNGINQIDVDYGAFGAGYTDNIFVQLERALAIPIAGVLNFTGAADGSLHAYKLTGSLSDPYLIDYSDLFEQKLIAPTIGFNQLSFAREGDADETAAFAFVNAASLKTPASILATQIDDINSATNGADYIVLTHDNFQAAALEYAAYRQAHDNLRVRVVKISDVFAQFSGGRQDPVAIRDFLRHAYNNWSGARPSFCLLVGDGIYDFRNNLGTGGVNYIPPFIVAGDETVSDENFVFLDSLLDLDSDNSYPTDRGVDMVISRWPVKTTAEFQAVFEKMKRYESGTDAGSWRNTITLIADDENHPSSGFPEIFHTEDTETLAVSIIPPTFVLQKIYGVSYPFGAAAEKPAMREDIIRAINDGRLIVNYTGHGNQNLWADERVFRRTQDIARLNNAVRLPLIFNASCSIGFFDDPKSEGMAEDLLRYANGGAVGTISATRLVYSRPNFEFNKAGMQQLLGENNYTIAEAMYVTKLLRQGAFGVGDNDRKYIYIGDPLTRLAVAPNRIQFVKFQPDSLVALTVTELGGQIVDRDGVKQANFDGTATVSVFDNLRERSVSVTFGGTVTPVTYSEYGPEIFRGKIAVNDGDFDLKFVVPKDITYGGDNARISSYAAGSGSGAAGTIFPVAIGSINKEVIDSVGPEIALSIAGTSEVTDGMTLPVGVEFTVELFDSLGINLSGEIGHGIEVQFDDDREFTYELTDSFTYVADSYQRGSAKMKLPELPDGEHVLRVKAWDSANNSSQKLVNVNVSSAGGLEIRDLLCYPNPVKQDCEFSYTLSGDADEVVLKLFTLSGLEIWSQTGLPSTRGYHQGIAWNGRDTDGDTIANGVYLMQLSARPASGSGENVDNSKATATGKLVVIK